MRHRAASRVLVAWSAALVAAACGSPGSEPPLHPTVDPACLLAPEHDRVTEPVVVALTDRVDPAGAPNPGSESERLLFAHLYETLINVDCRGRIRPGLAASWAPEEQGRRWRFTLRPDAVFWDGTAVTAREVIDAWARNPRPEVAAVLDSVTVLADRVLRIAFARRVESPALLADPAFAVAKPGTEAEWASGTSRFRVMQERQGTATIGLARVGEARAAIEFRVAPMLDARDFLDEAVDVLVTDQPAAIAYAAARDAFVVRPLAWNRSYVLLSPERVRTGHSGALAPLLLDGLARDAVRSDSRRAEPPFWWREADRCETMSSVTAQPATETEPGGVPRVVYARGDATARDLAERLVALAATPGSARMLSVISPAWSDPRIRLVAAGLERETFGVHLREASEFAYVLAVQRRVPDRCRAVSVLSAQAPWLTSQAGDAPSGIAAAMLPLVDTRAHAVLRRDRAGATIDWYGTLRLVLP